MSILHSSRVVARYFKVPHDVALGIIARHRALFPELVAEECYRTSNGFNLTEQGMKMLAVAFTGPKAMQWKKAFIFPIFYDEVAELEKQLAA